LYQKKVAARAKSAPEIGVRRANRSSGQVRYDGRGRLRVAQQRDQSTVAFDQDLANDLDLGRQSLSLILSLDSFDQIVNRLKPAVTFVNDVTGSHGSDAVSRSTENLLVDLALGRFRRRPTISALTFGIQTDIRAFFGSYSNACRQADALLFQAGNPGAVDEACRQSPRRQTAAERARSPSHGARIPRPTAARL
jgi:hypothetical protein